MAVSGCMPVVATLPAENNGIVGAMIDDQLVLIDGSRRFAHPSQKCQRTAGQSHARYMP